jgi:hypothetical protein
MRSPILSAPLLLWLGCHSSSTGSNLAAGGQGENGSDGAPSSNVAVASTPCDPFARNATPLGPILAAGKDGAGTLYVADQPSGSGEPRAFVSQGSRLQRWHVLGSGQEGGGNALTEYTLSIESPESDGADAIALLFGVQSGAPTGMAIGPADSKSFLGAAGQTPLTLVDPSSVRAMSAIDLPARAAYVLDASNGDAIVITAPGDNPSTDDDRLFYGAPANLAERKIVSFEQSRSGYPTIQFWSALPSTR